MKRDTKTDKHRLHTVCSTHVDVQLPLLRFDFNKLHLIGYLDVACSGGFLSLLAMVFYWDNLTHTSSPKPSVNMHPPTPEEYGWDLFDVVPGAGHSKDQWEAGGIKPKRWRQLGQQFDTKINCFSLLLEYIFSWMFVWKSNGMLWN